MHFIVVRFTFQKILDKIMYDFVWNLLAMFEIYYLKFFSEKLLKNKPKNLFKILFYLKVTKRILKKS